MRVKQRLDARGDAVLWDAVTGLDVRVLLHPGWGVGDVGDFYFCFLMRVRFSDELGFFGVGVGKGGSGCCGGGSGCGGLDQDVISSLFFRGGLC